MLSRRLVRQSVREEVAERPILVIGCSLGNHMAEVPKFVLQHFVTVVQRVYAGSPLRYGYSECEYVRGRSCTWEGDVDQRPCSNSANSYDACWPSGALPECPSWAYQPASTKSSQS